uniref:ubiquitinyl hydrolase 1 n=1 Tax=Cacopsylla melanoneura TaxID=428564 RepID=A0A8D8S0N9_9HEMI
MDSIKESYSSILQKRPKTASKRKVEENFDIDPILSDEEDSGPSPSKRRTVTGPVVNRLCPYLDTINRQVLDFDFEKLCSVSLSRINVYACLVCGKYFQGRGTNTHAYTHSVAESHHVFLNLHTLKFYCLPDNYEIVDSSLDDIKYVLNPTFTTEQIKQLDTSDKTSRAIDGTLYLPGIVGLNNIKANDYCNVILQALCHVTPLRNYFLREINYARIKRPPGDSSFLLVQRFGELMRKLWNPRNFKSHVSPHEMLQAVVLWSRKRFQFTEQSDPIDFLSWFLNTLHRALNGTKKRDSSIVYKTFLGSMKVNLYTILTKFNNESEKEYKTYKENFLKRFEITSLPPYLIIYVKRFTKNTFFVEKNPTIVNFPVKNIDFGDILTPEVKAKYDCTMYDLVANIVHDGEPSNGTYRVHLLHKGTGKWYEMQDLHVTDILPQMITLTEAYIQIYELRTNPSSNENSDK